MRRNSFLLVIGLLFLWGLLSSFDYAGEWGTVRDLMQSQPKSALEKINAIDKRAKREKKLPQELACIIQRGNARSYIDDSAFVDCLAELKAFQRKTKDEVARSVASYLEGTLYLRYYERNRWVIGQRKELQDTVPDDMNEWTSRLFIDKIRECLFGALANEKLKSVPVLEYEAILEKGEDSRIYRPLLYDFLLSRIWDNRNVWKSKEEKKKYQKEWVALHEKDKTQDAYVEAKLMLMKNNQDEIIEANGYQITESIVQQYISDLESLLNEVKNDPASILVRVALCSELSGNSYLHSLPKDSDIPQRLKDICEEGIKTFPNHAKISYLKNIVKQLEKPLLTIKVMNKRITTSDKVRLKIEYANVQQLKLNLSRLDISSSYDYRVLGSVVSSDMKNDTTFQLQSFLFSLSKSNYCIPQDTVLEIPPLDYGVYRLRTDSVKNEFVDFEVSDLFYLRVNAFKDPSYYTHYVLMDAKSGAPKPNVNLSAFKSSHIDTFIDTLDIRTTDSSGFASLKLPTPFRFYDAWVFFEDGKDLSLPPDHYTCSLERSDGISQDNSDSYVAIFTDRSVYRPSQTVYYKAVFYGLDAKGDSLLTHQKVLMVLKDCDGNEVAEDTLWTNEFGSVASSFVIPEGATLGSYYISAYGCDDEDCDLDYEIYGHGEWKRHFLVMEYKRPTFEVKMTRPTESFALGDTIRVKGKSEYLMGAPLTGVTVKYRVDRSRWGRNTTQIAEGTCVVSEDGLFVIPFVADTMRNPDKGEAYYQYNVYATVTDANGETQEDCITVSVGNRSLAFSSEFQHLVEMGDFSKRRCLVTNIDGEGQAVAVSYEVMRENALVTSGNVRSDEKGTFVIPENTVNWLPGRYKVILKAWDERRREVTSAYDMILFRKGDKRPPVDTVFWHENVKDVTLSYGEPYKVRVGSSLKEGYLLQIVSDQHGLVERRWSKLSDEIKDFTFRLEQKNGDCLNVKFFLVKEGSLYSTGFTIERKRENKILPLQLAVFRDKLLPGAKETWTLTLPKGKQAEVLASMYDASLDKFVSQKWQFDNQWSFSPEYRCDFYFPKVIWSKSSYGRWTVVGNPWGAYVSSRMNWHFDRLIKVPSGLQLFAERTYVLKKTDVTGAVPIFSSDSYDDSSDELFEEIVTVGYGVQRKKTTIPQSNFRSNFAETAFFYPHLRTDKKGNVQFSFEVPESLTRWNFRALAHTKDLFYGQCSGQMVTQKDFMITPNLPRFLRKGDRCVMSAKIVNLSESTVEGTAIMEFMDPVTEKVVAKKETKFSVAAEKNGFVTWQFDVPREMEAVLVRTSAVADNFSDAEQSLLPILSDRIVLTQSLPLYVRGGQTKDYTFENLVNNHSEILSSHFLKLEFAKNPVWYAVQALPSVATVEYENAVSYSAAHFASLLSAHIAKSNPKIFNVINSWRNQGGDKQTLLSNLEKNKEVKNILLNETPWVMEAKNETEMKQRLSTLFDLDDLQGKCNKWFEKLADFRLPNGAYSWFKTQSPSRHTTLFVLDNLGRLRKAGIADEELLKKAKYRSSLSYLDTQMRDWYESLKRRYPNDYKDHAYVDMGDLYYFQVRSLFPEVKKEDRTAEAFSFFYDLVKDRWKDLSLYGKALAAIAFYRNGDQALAKTVVNSLREYSKTTDEMGMYWPTNVSGYLWSESSVATHTRIMEALEVVDPNVEEQDEMRLWLLNRKRTQNWDNTIANVDALNVLLLSGSDWLANDNKVSIQMGGQSVQPEGAEAGTGYFTKYIAGDEVKPSMGKVELKSEAGGNISWGALYWQYEEEMEKVEKNNSSLHVERLVLLEQREAGKPVLKKIGEGTKLSVGDKLVVRLTLCSDRNMDYVSLKDQRASCLEPVQQLPGYHCSEGTCYYQLPKDAAMYYFFDHLAKGTYVFEYPLWVTHAGDYCNGITTAQCLYAPEFLTNTGSVRIQVEEGK